MKAGPVVSDNGQFIIDAPFPEELMAKPAEVSYARYPRTYDAAYCISPAVAIYKNVDWCC
jgi:hypothetical protein